jgi:hypothetical protein
MSHAAADSTLALRGVLERSWGAAKDARDRHDDPIAVWFNPSDGIRAVLASETGDLPMLELSHYIPVAQLLGAGPELPFVKRTVVGKHPSEMIAAFDARSRDARLPTIDLLPTEWELEGETFNGVMTMGAGTDEKVVSYCVTLPYRAFPPARDEIRTVAETKWGKPEPVEGGLRFVRGAVEVVALEVGDASAWQICLEDSAAMKELMAVPGRFDPK